MMRQRIAVLACAVALAAAACGGKKTDEPAVASPSLSLNKNRVAMGSPVILSYKFVVAPGAAIDGDYTVFVHVLDPDGEQLWADDHTPAVPTSRWKPGQTIEYTRTVFVPNYPYIGEAAVHLGLYSLSSGKRLALSAQEVSRKEYLVTRFEILPQGENIFLIYKDGWHPAEVAADNPTTEWQWTKKTATLSFRNPKKDATFYLDWDARTDLFTPPQQVGIRIGDQSLAAFAADSRQQKLLTFPITAAQFGNADMVELVIEVNRTFVPGVGDTRELGIRVFHAFIEPK
jgi:hypothetical protein